MELYIPKDFVEVSSEEFWHLLGNINWTRDAFCGGEDFRAKDFTKRRDIHDGLIEMRSKKVGVHAYTYGVPNSDRYLIDPTFFKPVEAA